MPEETGDINDTMDLIKILEDKLDRLSKEEIKLIKERTKILKELEECREESVEEIPNGISN